MTDYDIKERTASFGYALPATLICLHYLYNVYIIKVIFVLRIALLEKENHRLIDEYENVVHDIRQKSDRAFDELKKERDNTTAKVGFSTYYYLFIYLFIICLFIYIQYLLFTYLFIYLFIIYLSVCLLIYFMSLKPL